ncbi:hypothetical protein DFH08DRAFT_906979 [Mycena albidolilacea]|uniref:AMP-dependent synthetase/ligase domain-containing protein n=1 Tax=Mycena albidolilacea TaxID=1033008 RepID=A0AAD6YXT5_9AGAR|nr:hypothetical protein DFH08DRAFT_906979 [Mycena albidolilacea]
MHAQGIDSPTFTAAPLDGSLTMPQLLDRQFELSPHHTAYIYDAPDGETISVSFVQYIQTVYIACRRILRETVPHKPVTDGQATVVGIFAATGMMVAAIMRAGLVPFCISPRNAAAGVADLLEKTGAAVVYVSADRKEILAEAFEIWGKQLPVFDALGFEVLPDSPKELSESRPSPTLPTTMNLDSPGMILHTSGSTSIYSKPVYLSHKMVLQYASIPWTGSEDHCGQILGSQVLPNFHGLGIFMSTWPFSSGLIMAVLRPSTPQIPPTPKNALAGILATHPDLIMSTPAAIESWSGDPAGLKAMQAAKAVSYIGATMNKCVGDSLVASGVVLCSSYGAMETGLLMPFFNCHGKDWEYFTLRKNLDVVRTLEDDGSGLYTHTYLTGPSYATSYTNVVIDGRPGCCLSDLLEQHPDNPELHRVYGRKDDLIAFSTAAKVQAQINRNDLVDAAVVFGINRPYPGVLIQLKPQFQAQLSDGDKRSEVCDALWASVDAANKTSSSHFHIPRKMVLLADPRKPFALTSKSQPRRHAVCKDYEEEICAAYM